MVPGSEGGSAFGAAVCWVLDSGAGIFLVILFERVSRPSRLSQAVLSSANPRQLQPGSLREPCLPAIQGEELPRFQMYCRSDVKHIKGAMTAFCGVLRGKLLGNAVNFRPVGGSDDQRAAIEV